MPVTHIAVVVFFRGTRRASGASPRERMAAGGEKDQRMKNGRTHNGYQLRTSGNPRVPRQDSNMSGAGRATMVPSFRPRCHLADHRAGAGGIHRGRVLAGMDADPRRPRQTGRQPGCGGFAGVHVRDLARNRPAALNVACVDAACADMRVKAIEVLPVGGKHIRCVIPGIVGRAHAGIVGRAHAGSRRPPRSSFVGAQQTIPTQVPPEWRRPPSRPHSRRSRAAARKIPRDTGTRPSGRTTARRQ